MKTDNEEQDRREKKMRLIRGSMSLARAWKPVQDLIWRHTKAPEDVSFQDIEYVIEQIVFEAWTEGEDHMLNNMKQTMFDLEFGRDCAASVIRGRIYQKEE